MYDKASDTTVETTPDGGTKITKGDQDPIVFPADAGTTTTDENSDKTIQTDAGVTPTETDGGTTISLPDSGTISVTIVSSDGGTYFI